jgi:glycosyltransferase involved in cell wall biosynthesis
MSYKSININDRTSEITFITIGRFIHSKINLLTLKVILEFKRKYKKPFKFYIVGDGYERKKLENFCLENDLKDNVIFTGWIERNQVFEYLSKSDIYYSTTFKEGGTWAFFEAVAIGLPVVCLKISGPDMIVGDNCGMKIDPSNPEKVIEDLSNALLELSNNSEKRKELSNKAKDYLMGNLTWSQMMNRIETIYDDILKK